MYQKILYQMYQKILCQMYQMILYQMLPKVWLINTYFLDVADVALVLCGQLWVLLAL